MGTAERQLAVQASKQGHRVFRMQAAEGSVVYFCRRCGCHSQKQTKGLGAVCKAGRSTQRRYLRGLMQGRSPYNGLQYELPRQLTLPRDADGCQQGRRSQRTHGRVGLPAHGSPSPSRLPGRMAGSQVPACSMRAASTAAVEKKGSNWVDHKPERA